MEDLAMNLPVVNYNKLRGRIKEKLGTEGKFAEMIGASRVHICRIWKNESYFSYKEMLKAMTVLEIPTESIAEFFFAI